MTAPTSSRLTVTGTAVGVGGGVGVGGVFSIGVQAASTSSAASRSRKAQASSRLHACLPRMGDLPPSRRAMVSPVRISPTNPRTSGAPQPSGTRSRPKHRRRRSSAGAPMATRRIAISGPEAPLPAGRRRSRPRARRSCPLAGALPRRLGRSRRALARPGRGQCVGGGPRCRARPHLGGACG